MNPPKKTTPLKRAFSAVKAKIIRERYSNRKGASANDILSDLETADPKPRRDLSNQVGIGKGQNFEVEIDKEGRREHLDGKVVH